MTETIAVEVTPPPVIAVEMVTAQGIPGPPGDVIPPIMTEDYGAALGAGTGGGADWAHAIRKEDGPGAGEVSFTLDDPGVVQARLAVWGDDGDAGVNLYPGRAAISGTQRTILGAAESQTEVNGSAFTLNGQPWTPNPGMGDLTDVDLTGVGDGDSLAFDLASGLWLPFPPISELPSGADVGESLYTGAGGLEWRKLTFSEVKGDAIHAETLTADLTIAADSTTGGVVIGNQSGSGLLRVKSDMYVGRGLNSQGVFIQGGLGDHGLEIGRSDGVSSSPFIDFHSGTVATGFDSRLQAGGGDGTLGSGTLAVDAAQLSVQSTKNAAALIVMLSASATAGVTPALTMRRSGAGNTATPNGGTLGKIVFDGRDSANALFTRAQIEAVTGTNAPSGPPTRLVFYTSPSGAAIRTVLTLWDDLRAAFAGRVDTPASVAGMASLRIPHGAAPSSPVDGDMWTTTAGLFVRVNGVTRQVTVT